MAEVAEHGVAALMKRLRDDLVLLVREEVALAKTEVSEKTTRAGKSFGSLAAGALLGYTGVIVVLIAISAALEILLIESGMGVTAHWLAPFIVGSLVALVGYTLAQKALAKLRNESLTPENTVRSLQEDKEWLQSKAT